jgi:transposase
MRGEKPKTAVDVDADVAGDGGADGPPDPSDQEACGRGPGEGVANIRRDVRVGGAAVDPPERLLKAQLLMALYTVRSERQLCEQIAYSLLFRWFLDMDMVEPSFDATVFTKNRDRLLEHDVAGEFFRLVVEQVRAGRLMSGEHFTVEGTLIEARASLKSFKKKDASKSEPPDDPGNPMVDFRGEKRSNETHASTTDPEAKLARKSKGKEAKLCFSAHALMENRNGLLVDLRVAEADGRAERDTALFMLADHKDPTRTITVAGDKGYDTHDFVVDCRAINVVPHVAQNFHERRQSDRPRLGARSRARCSPLSSRAVPQLALLTLHAPAVASSATSSAMCRCRNLGAFRPPTDWSRRRHLTRRVAECD